MELSQREFEQLMENWSNGAPSPFYKRERRLRDAEPARVATFAGEEVRWIGTVDTDMFSDRGNKDFGVLIGVSLYRVVFYRATTVFDDLCRSYWFEVDVEGRTWEEGRVRKKEYRAIGVARPMLKKGMMSQKIVVVGRKTRTNGKEDTVFEHELTDLKWLNRQTREFDGGKGQNLYHQLMKAYDSRIPISVSNLWLMQNDSERAILTTPGPVVDGMAVREEPMRSMPPAAPETAHAPALPIDIEVEAIVELGPQPSVEACAQCDNPLKPGISFCGKCGCPLEAGAVEERPPQAKEIPMDYCPGCGNPLKAGISFCGKCGYRLEREAREEEPLQAEAATEEATMIEDVPDAEAVAETAITDKCPSCGKPVEADWMVCAYCAASLAAQCPECERAIEADWRVCPYCGTALNR
jgi:hypothetical protein